MIKSAIVVHKESNCHIDESFLTIVKQQRRPLFGIYSGGNDYTQRIQMQRFNFLENGHEG